MQHPREETTPREAWALVAILVLAAVMRLREAWTAPLWFDEIYLVEVARRSPREILDLASRDIHPPLGFLLFSAWRAFAGEADIALKTLPVAIGLATVLLTWRLGRDAFGRGAGLLAAAIVALHPLHIQLSQEVETYALIALLPVVMAWLAWRWSQRGDARDAVAFAVTAVVSLYTHYILAFAVLAIALWGLAASPETAARRRWLLAQGAVALAFLPQVAVLVEQFRREGSGSFFHWPNLGDLVRLARTALPGGPHALPAGVAVAGLALLSPRTRKAAWLIALAAAVPILSRRLLPVVVPRDFVYLAPLGSLLAAAGAFVTPPRARAWVAAGLMLFAGRDIVRAVPFDEPRALARAASAIRADGGTDWMIHAETHALLFGKRYLPGMRHRLLYDGRRVPFYEGGLVVADSECLARPGWDSLRATARWRGLRVDRARVTRGVVSRAGEAEARALDEAGGPPRRFGPVSVWGAPPLRSAARGPATR